MRRILFFLTALMLMVTAASAEKITIGTLSFEVPDSLVRVPREQLADCYNYAAYNPDIYVLVAYLNTDGLDMRKVEAKADSTYFPRLRGLVPVDVKEESWDDWTHNYKIRSYRLADSTLTTVCQVNANNLMYLIYSAAANEAGEAQVENINKSVHNSALMDNAPGWWGCLLGFFFVGMLILSLTVAGDDGFTLGSYFKLTFITLIIVAAFTAYFCRHDWSFYPKVLMVSAGIIFLVPIFRKPINWIMENAD